MLTNDNSINATISALKTFASMHNHAGLEKLIVLLEKTDKQINNIVTTSGYKFSTADTAIHVHDQLITVLNVKNRILEECIDIFIRYSSQIS